jgi:hypothetical protein
MEEAVKNLFEHARTANVRHGTQNPTTDSGERVINIYRIGQKVYDAFSSPSNPPSPINLKKTFELPNLSNLSDNTTTYNYKLPGPEDPATDSDGHVIDIQPGEQEVYGKLTNINVDPFNRFPIPPSPISLFGHPSPFGPPSPSSPKFVCHYDKDENFDTTKFVDFDPNDGATKTEFINKMLKFQESCERCYHISDMRYCECEACLDEDSDSDRMCKLMEKCCVNFHKDMCKKTFYNQCPVCLINFVRIPYREQSAWEKIYFSAINNNTIRIMSGASGFPPME